MTVTITGKLYTYTAGNANKASQVNAEFAALYGNDTAIKTKVDALLSGNIEDGTAVTINSAFSGTPTSNLSLVAKRGASSDTAIRWNETSDKWELTNDGTNYIGIAPAQKLTNIANPTYASASTFTIAWGEAMNSTGVALMSHTATKTLNIATSGANGLDTGTEANSTWYYLYMIGKTDGTTDYVLSVTNESVSGSITLPSGYTLKRQMPFAVRNDSSGNFLPFFVQGRQVFYTGESGQALSSAGPLTLLNSGTATTFTDVACSSVVPAISQLVMLDIYSTAAINGRYFQLRPKGETHNGYQWYVSAGTPDLSFSRMLSTNSSQQIQYSQAGGAGTGYLSLFCQGYIVTGAL